MFLWDKWNVGILMTFSQMQTSGDDSRYGAITVEELSGIPEFDGFFFLFLHVCVPVIRQVDRILFFFLFFLI